MDVHWPWRQRGLAVPPVLPVLAFIWAVAMIRGQTEDLVRSADMKKTVVLLFAGRPESAHPKQLACSCSTLALPSNIDHHLA